MFGMGRLAKLTQPDETIPGSVWAFLASSIGSVVGGLTGSTPVIVQVETAAGINEGGRTGLTAVTIGCLFLCSVFLAPLFGTVRRVWGRRWVVWYGGVGVTVSAYEKRGGMVSYGGMGSARPSSTITKTVTTPQTTTPPTTTTTSTPRPPNPLSHHHYQVPQTATAPILVLVGAMMMGESKKIDWSNMSEAVPAYFTTVMMPFSYRYYDLPTPPTNNGRERRVLFSLVWVVSPPFPFLLAPFVLNLTKTLPPKHTTASPTASSSVSPCPSPSTSPRGTPSSPGPAPSWGRRRAKPPQGQGPQGGSRKAPPSRTPRCAPPSWTAA